MKPDYVSQREVFALVDLIRDIGWPKFMLIVSGIAVADGRAPDWLGQALGDVVNRLRKGGAE